MTSGAWHRGRGPAVARWLEERAGLRTAVRWMADEPIPGGARWAYVFGSALVALFAVQFASGVLLAMGYSPSANDAWASVWYLQNRTPGGWFLRGLHSNGASAMVIVLACHLLQTALFGAYKAPRELNWIVGVLLLGAVMGFALTGYLLPWDQKGYFATRVATSIIGTAPALGPALQKIVQGGADYGHLTLTRFYALHVIVLPAAVALLVGVHVALFRRHGVTPPASVPASAPVETFVPRQFALDALFALAVIGLMALRTAHDHGAPLEAPADPSSSYLARPEWYFLFLFQLVKYFEGPAEVIGTVVIPTAAFAFLIALPFLDRGPSRAPEKRLPFVGAILAGFIGVALLTGQALREDANSPQLAEARRDAEKQAHRASELAAKGIPAEGALAVWENDPDFRARRIWAERCQGCHVLDGKGGEKAPDLTGWNSRAWLDAFLQDPDAPRFFGRTKIHKMKPAKSGPDDRRALVEYLVSFAGASASPPADPALAERGKEIYESDLEQCDNCHERDGTSDLEGPNHGGRGTRAAIRDFLRAPAEPRFFGKKNDMPSMVGKLSEEEIDMMAGMVERLQRAGRP